MLCSRLTLFILLQDDNVLLLEIKSILYAATEYQRGFRSVLGRHAEAVLDRVALAVDFNAKLYGDVFSAAEVAVFKENSESLTSFDGTFIGVACASGADEISV